MSLSMASRPLNEEEVQRELNKMISFILQEAEEKANELRIKANEESSIERSTILQQGRRNVLAIYEKKERQMETEKKIIVSNQAGRARLRLLEGCHAALENIIQDARKRLHTLRTDDRKLKSLIRNLALQSLLQILEPEVVLQTTKKDFSYLQSIQSDLVKDYEQMTGRSIKLSIDSTPISDDCGAGVVALSRTNGVRCTNTLETRLYILAEKMLPQIRELLLGSQA